MSRSRNGRSIRNGSYTTARVTGGRVERVERHARRLLRDAERLGLPLPGLRDIEQLLVETAVATFGRGDGIVRVEWSQTGGDPPELFATPRSIGAEPDVWCAARSKATHPGPEHRHNTKYVAVDAYDVARAETTEKAIDEVLLFDADGILVEGGRSNFLVVTKDGQLSTPAPELGAVEGLGLSIALESVREIRFVRLAHDDIDSARELISVNVVRGSIPIVELDGRPICEGLPGDWARRLHALFRLT